MKFKIVKLLEISGNEASVYSVIVNDSSKTLFEKFIEEHIATFKDELKNLIGRINTIANKTGAREHFFKKDEGAPGDGVWALYDTPNSNLRLYCIRYGTGILLLGGGGYKPKTIRALQEDPKLTEENYLLRDISRLITSRIMEKYIIYINNDMDFKGDLDFEDEN